MLAQLQALWSGMSLNVSEMSYSCNGEAIEDIFVDEEVREVKCAEATTKAPGAWTASGAVVGDESINFNNMSCGI